MPGKLQGREPSRRKASSISPAGGATSRVAVLLLLALGPVAGVRAQTAAELIEQARQSDPGYGAGMDRQKALELYEKALAAQPEAPQRLDCLFRIGQLQGCIFDPRKGERPDFRKAIRYYQQIVESYPPEEPMALTAIGLISDHYTSLHEYDAALAWARRAVDYDTSRAEQRIREIQGREASLADTQYSPEERRAIIEESVRSASLQEGLQRMQERRVLAVDRVARAATYIDPMRAHGELRAIADKYAGTPVGDRATRRLQESMDKRMELWAPDLRPPQGPAATWRPESGTWVLGPRGPNDASAPGPPVGETNPGPSAPAPDTSTGPATVLPLTELPRAPPRALRFACVVAAGLLLVGLAALTIRRKTQTRSSDYES